MKQTVLIVDDNQDILEFISVFLSEHYEVYVAENVADALEILKEQTVHLIVTDIMMPSVDGFTFCDIVKSSEEFCHIPVIMLTARKELSYKYRGLEFGAEAYLGKPFSPKHLILQISNLLKNRKIIKSYFAHSPVVMLSAEEHGAENRLFLERLNQIIMENLDNVLMDGEFLSRAMNMSRTTLYRRLSELSVLKVHELIINSRLKKAAELLATGNYKVYEVSDITGFSSPNHFHRSFLKMYKLSPSQFIKDNGS